MRGAALTPELRLSAIYAFFTALNGYQVGALTGFEAFRSIARITIGNGLAGLLLTWGLTLRFGLHGAVMAQGLAASLLWLQYQLAVRQECRARSIPVRLRGAWRERASLFRCAIPATICGILGSVAIWRCNVVLVEAAGYAALAVFSAANTLRLIILFLPALVLRVASPILNNLLANGDWHAYRRTFWTAVALNASMALLLAIVCALAGRQILRVFGKGFVPSTALMLLLLGSVVVEVAATNLYQAIFTSRSLWRQAVILTIWSSVLVGCSMAAVPRYGAAGLAAAYLAAWSVSAILYAGAARRQMQLMPKRRSQGSL